MCTGIQLKAIDNSIVFGRTLEFGIDLHSQAVFIPKGKSLVSNCKLGKTQYQWTSQYAMVGMNAEHLPIIVDGVNEVGLACGSFYFNQYAHYQEIKDNKPSIASIDFGTWILSHFATVSEVKSALNNITISNAPFEKWGFTCPLHYIINDKHGDCLVIEYINGECKTYDNDIGVITNSPPFDWHLINCGNYLHLRAENFVSKMLNNTNIKSTGEGSGMVGLPGDFTPPSRFIRALAFTQTVEPTENAQQAMNQAFHILNNFDIPKGSVRAQDGDIIYTDHTQWTSVSDCTNTLFYYHDYNNRRVRKLDLTQLISEHQDIYFMEFDDSTETHYLS